VRKLLIAVLVITAVAVLADFAAAAAAEHIVAQRMREQLKLPSDPSVRIHGFPFLTQALAGHYTAVDIQARGVAVDPLRDVEVDATLHDVDAPLTEVSAGDLHSVRAAWVDGRVRIKDSDLGRAIGIEDLRIQRPSAQEVADIQPASRQEPIRMVATTDLAGQRLEVVGLGVIELTGEAVRITTKDVRLAREGTGEVGLPRGVRQALIKTFSTDVKPGELPFAVTPTRITVDTGAVVVEGTASNVSMIQARAGRS
jgi:hypothetical protein